MHRVPPWKIAVVVTILLASLWVLVPTFRWYSIPAQYRTAQKTQRLIDLQDKLDDPDADVENLREQIREEEDRIQELQNNAIQLGLDLQGGVHLVLDVDLDKAIQDMPQEEFDPGEEKQLRDSIHEQATMVVRQRVDEWGVAEPVVQKVPPNQIVVELPGYSNPEQAADLLQTTAQLRFHLLADWNDATQIMEDIDAQVAVDLMGEILRTSTRSLSAEFFVREQDVNLVKEILSRQSIQDLVPTKYTFRWSDVKEPVPSLFGDEPYRSLYLLNANAELTGNLLANASFTLDQANFNEPKVLLQFDSKGTRIFARLSRQHRGERLAIVLDEIVYLAPYLRTEVTAGRAEITGINDVEEAQKIAVVLRAGALPADISVAANDVVGASLGEDSIRKGVRSAIGGFIVVVIFMAVYYALCGVIADGALILNLIILMAGMALLRATLTLPGIAGIILTIGMAVDANVLIFERMREELGSRRSKTLAGIVDRSYSRAFMTIFDANLTTLMTAVVLFQFGTGPIKGFAVTLTMGILISMFTALFVTRIVFDYIAASGKGKDAAQILPIGKFRVFENVNYNFVGRIIPFMIGSSTLAIAGILSIVLHHGVNKGIDFAGGTLLYLNFEKPVAVETIRDALPADQQDAIIQKVISGEDNRVNLRTRATEQEQANQILASLRGAMPDNQPEILESRVVGPQVGEELGKQALWCIIFGSILILLYVTLRFEFTFAVAALLAVAHDVMITVTVFSFLNKEFTLPVVAAILTIVGYSVNDTIVVFDRIRENCRRKEGEVRKSIKAFREEVNRSINQTLSRTTLTSATTLFVVLSIYFFGGEVINDFVFALLVGVIVGTYSSIFVASPIVVWWRGRKAS